MIEGQDLIEQVRAYNPKTDERLIGEAYRFSMKMHEGQHRHSGAPFFTHPAEVAAILADQKLDDATIVTGLLHDTVEDTCASHKQIAETFGKEIADLVDGVTKLTNLPLANRNTWQAENFRKLFMATTRDVRVILVKFADRLHNMRSIAAMHPDKQMQKARETMEIFAPLAGRMGMQWMRDELEDLAFGVLNPKGRQTILRRLERLAKENGDVTTRIADDMRAELKKAGVKAEVQGRAKKPYSIWRKMREKEVGFSRLSDIYGFRVITGDESGCYEVLGVIHRKWRAVPGRFKDYISQPKSNGYRSIHTTVSGRAARRVEVQIRTRQMHDVAEIGVAAHWSYRDGIRAENPFAADPVNWIETLFERINPEDHSEFLETVKLEMYADQVFCFTPKGDVVKLPRGATAIDFAYAVHTRVGHSCVGAKIDGMRQPLWTPLRSGQSIEVIRSERGAPSQAWMDIATTGKAKAAIRRALRERVRDRSVEMGRALLRSAFGHARRKVTGRALANAAEALKLKSAEEVLAKVGTSDLTAQEVLRAVHPESAPKSADLVRRERAVIGLTRNQRFERAGCCQPLPGERIAGIAKRGKGVEVHAATCKSLSKFENRPERLIDLEWDTGRHPAEYDATLELSIFNDAGSLGRVCTLLGEQGANISNLALVGRKGDYFRLRICVELSDAEHLQGVVAVLTADDVVSKVRRVRNPAWADA